MPNASYGLILLDCANRLLSEVSSFDNLKDVRDAAEAARTFAKAAQLGLELQKRAAELKLRAERRAGALLAELHIKSGGRRSKEHRAPLKLEEFGVSRQQSGTRSTFGAAAEIKQIQRLQNYDNLYSD